MGKKKIRTIVYLGADAFTKGDEIKKKKQWKCIKEYAKAHNLQIVKIVDTSYLSKGMRKEQIRKIASDIFYRKAEAMLVTNVRIVADDISEAYRIAGRVASVGGRLITVDDGELFLNIKMLPVRGKKEVEENKICKK